MAYWEQGWNPAGVTFDITITASDIKRTGETSFTADIYVKWYGHFSKTNYGMTASAGGKTIGIPYYNGSNNRSGEGTIQDASFSIASASTTSATVTISLCNYKTDVSSPPYYYKNFSLTIKDIAQWWTGVGPGSTSITDNYDNTFTVSGTVGSNGTNNAVTKGTLSWTCYKPNGSWWTNTSNNYPSENFTVSNTVRSKSKTFNLANFGGMGTAATRKAAVNILTIGTKGDSIYNTDGVTPSNAFRWLDIKQYIAPSVISDLKINYNKNRLTIKEPWRFSWTAATAGNTTSQVKGYRIRLFKNDVEIPIKNSSGQVISLTNSSYGGHPYDTNSTSTSFTIYPDKQDFAAGDTVAILVHAYTRYGVNNERTGESNYVFSPYVMSSNYKVQNAGIVQVRTSSGWHEGQVHIRSASGWHEAETVQVRAASGWHESE